MFDRADVRRNGRRNCSLLTCCRIPPIADRGEPKISTSFRLGRRRCPARPTQLMQPFCVVDEPPCLPPSPSRRPLLRPGPVGHRLPRLTSRSWPAVFNRRLVVAIALRRPLAAGRSRENPRHGRHPCVRPRCRRPRRPNADRCPPDRQAGATACHWCPSRTPSTAGGNSAKLG